MNTSIGTKPDKLTFPERNRSGLSDGVIVVEARKESGSLITVDHALEQGKNVYAIPGNITSKYSEGTNELIRQGAKLLTSIKDVLEEKYAIATETINNKYQLIPWVANVLVSGTNADQRLRL